MRGVRRCLVCAVWLTALSCRKEARPSAQRQSEPAVDSGMAIPTSESTPLAPDSGMGTPVSDSTFRSAAAFTQEFYDWYAKMGENDYEATRDRPLLFAPQLLAAVRAQRSAPASSLDEAYDGNMFLGGAQELCNPYRVQRVTRRGDTILVLVKGLCAEPNTPSNVVIAELGQVRGGWVFLDFRDIRLGSTSLLQDLASLRQCRDSTRRTRLGDGKQPN